MSMLGIYVHWVFFQCSVFDLLILRVTFYTSLFAFMFSLLDTCQA